MKPHGGRLVRDAMLSLVKVLPATATVGDVERFFDDDHVHLAVLADDDTVISTVTRQDLLAVSVPSGTPARELGTLADRVVGPDDGLDVVRDEMLARRQRRVVVVDADFGLRGLLCMKRRSQDFCADGDLRDRASSTAGEQHPMG